MTKSLEDNFCCPSVWTRRLSVCSMRMQIIAAVTDNSVRVWDAYTGVLLHRLSGHSRAVHVLEAHPWQPGLVLSGSYDGTLNIWDIAAGHRLTRYCHAHAMTRCTSVCLRHMSCVCYLEQCSCC